MLLSNDAIYVLLRNDEANIEKSKTIRFQPFQIKITDKSSINQFLFVDMVETIFMVFPFSW